MTWTLQTLAHQLGWGDNRTDREVWGFVVARERLLRTVQTLLQTHLSRERTAEGAIRERIASLTGASQQTAEQKAIELFLGRDKRVVLLERIAKAINEGHCFDEFTGRVEFNVPFGESAMVVYLGERT